MVAFFFFFWLPVSFHAFAMHKREAYRLHSMMFRCYIFFFEGGARRWTVVLFGARVKSNTNLLYDDFYCLLEGKGYFSVQFVCCSEFHLNTDTIDERS